MRLNGTIDACTYSIGNRSFFTISGHNETYQIMNRKDEKYFKNQTFQRTID